MTLHFSRTGRAVLGVFALAAVLGAVGSARANATFIVNSTADAVDAEPGDGACATAAGQCTLRAAIQEANAVPGADSITVPAGTYTITIPPMGADSLFTGDLNITPDAATGDFDITGDLTITAAGAASTIVDGNHLDRIFTIPGAATVVRIWRNRTTRF